MTANAEARALLDQLMGTDRDAPLPAGAALPSRSKRHNLGDAADGTGMILPSSKRSKSVYDRDIDPLYTAWGIDVYDLFVNTKSDIGPNPYTVDEGARKEYLALPPEEKERLGFEARLFAKLQELVQHGDRTIARNKEKLNRELQKQSQKRGVQAQNYVVDVPDGAIEELIRTEVQVNFMKEDVEAAFKDLADVRFKEQEIVKKLKEKEKPKEVEIKDGDNGEDVKEIDNPPEESNDNKNGPDKDEKPQEDTVIDNSAVLAQLGKLTLEKQRILCEIANIMSQLGPAEDSIEVQLRNLNHVKSDITADKTVCEVSGNFMSARDADERIAAHYAGKQYVGWKLVRDKLKEMIQKYGKHGPPRPGGIRGGGGAGAPLMSHQQYQQQQSYRREGRGGGGYGGGGGYRGGSDRREPRGERWERGSNGSSGGFDRGGYGRRDDRGGQFRDGGGSRGGYGRR
ncbi:LUC7 domain containing protein [Nitzschia inconspicua]|uniref:LUC7 domain containing protein n=1 Tax=Nitzschia inconspicua TaxID=303405 RepID=A0A9K3K3Y4_9STRA|nr:LUC7 domain containing protein [Nitzschia inconspicua]KAG7370047.1 LUC7 domain containing protein [Nitzschia inconspicua]